MFGVGRSSVEIRAGILIKTNELNNDGNKSP